MDTSVGIVIFLVIIAMVTNVRSFGCYECSYVVSGVDTCSDAQFVNKKPNHALNVTQCSGFCKKEIFTVLDETTSVVRSCSSACSEGCAKILGTGSCVSCCNHDKCNDSSMMNALPSLCAVFFGIVLLLSNINA